MLKHKATYKKFFGLLFVALFMVPLFSGTLHAFSDHKHEICFAKHVKHFHENDIDCSFQVIKNSTPFLTDNSFTSYAETEHLDYEGAKKNFLKSHQQLSFSLRGPPVTIRL